MPDMQPTSLQQASPVSRRTQVGLTLIELMVAMAISLVVMLAMVALFVNTSRSNVEMSKTNELIESGRIAIQLLAENLAHAGYWGGYLPEFDDLSFADVPSDAPTDIPNPCEPFASWTGEYRTNLLGVSVWSSDTLPAGAGCAALPAKRDSSDVLVVRHVETCLPGDTHCEADTPGNLYFQPTHCEDERGATAQGGSGNSITLHNSAAAVDDAYLGATIRLTSGPGAGQYRVISAYEGGTRIATVTPNWVGAPDDTTSYEIRYALGTESFALRKKDCATLSDKRKFVSNLYYLTDVVRNGQTIPALVRSQLDAVGGVVAHQTPVTLIEGVEALRVEFGVDDVGKTGAAVDNASAIVWADPSNRITPVNRGDGAPDFFVRCTNAAPCSVDQLGNTVVVRIHLLSRNRERTSGYTDTKSYCLGARESDGACPAFGDIAAANDNFKRHVFSTSVRLVNISGRRDTP
jgi:type IV pilus assembly protein PilW